MIGYLHVLAAGIVEQALGRIQLCQLGNGFRRGGIQLGQLLINGNGFYGEAILGILVAYALEIIAGPVILPHPGIKIANGVKDGKILRIFPDDLFVLSNSVLQLALLDKLLG